MIAKRSKSLSYETYDNPLCLCEYFNKNNERVHMLMCCCNCEAIDSLCTNILCSCCCSDDDSEFSENSFLFNQSITDILDRFRYPFFGGARKVNLDFILSIIIILTYTSIGSINFTCSIIILVLIPFILYLRLFISRFVKPKKPPVLNIKDLTKQSQSLNDNQNKIEIAHFLTINTLIYMLYLFNTIFYYEIKSVMTEIDRNIFNFILTTAIILHLYLHKSNPGLVNRRQENSGHCPICKSCVINRDHHCFWVDNCIGLYNHRIFVIYLIWLLILFTYSLLVIFKYFNSLECILISSVKDTNELRSCLFNVYYFNSTRGLLFLLLLQLVPLVFFLILLNLQQFLFISIGKTQQDLHRISQKNYKFSLAGYIFENLKIRFLIKNWLCFLNGKQKMSFRGNNHLI